MSCLALKRVLSWLELVTEEHLGRWFDLDVGSVYGDPPQPALVFLHHTFPHAIINRTENLFDPSLQILDVADHTTVYAWFDVPPQEEVAGGQVR